MLNNDVVEAHAMALNWTDIYFLEHSSSKDRFQWDVSTSRVFVSHKQLLFVTDEDPWGQNVSLKSVFATWMLKKVSVRGQ